MVLLLESLEVPSDTQTIILTPVLSIVSRLGLDSLTVCHRLSPRWLYTKECGGTLKHEVWRDTIKNK